MSGDSFRLRQALGNLVSNAVKFTDMGRVRICVEPGPVQGRKKGEDGSARLCLRILVQDTGPGLREEDAERIFESFQRGSDASGAPGTGLGLYIARTIARRMGGDVSVVSSPGSGACFTLEVCLHLPGDGLGPESGSGPGLPPDGENRAGAVGLPPGLASGAAARRIRNPCRNIPTALLAFCVRGRQSHCRTVMDSVQSGQKALARRIVVMKCFMWSCGSS